MRVENGIARTVMRRDVASLSLEQSVRLINSVLSTATLQDLIHTCHSFLESSYDGRSYWVDKQDSLGNWSRCFRVFADILHTTNCAGVEWWIRSVPATTSKTFHFDKDEDLFSTSGQLTHPTVGSVFYLSHIGGPTIVTPQIGDADGDELIPPVPKSLAASKPYPNRIFAFDGRLCHAVLPSNSQDLRQTLLMNWWNAKPRGVVASTKWTFPPLEKGVVEQGTPQMFSGRVFDLME